MFKRTKRVKAFFWLVAIFVAALVGFSICQAATVYRWSQIGAAPLMVGGVSDRVLLAELLDENKDSVVKGLALAEPSWDAAKVFDNI